VLVIGEITQGIERLAQRDPAQATVLRRWLDQLVHVYGDRIISVNADVAEAWGRLNVSDPLPVIDGLMAATALVNGWTLVTCNTVDVARTRVLLLDPFVPRA
jgi:predicted nucleic acid-binding protein